MKQIHERIIALLILCIPGALAVYGWTLIREAVFTCFAGQGLSLLAFIGGFICFFAGLTLVAGFIFYHDKKRNKVQARLLRKKEK